MEKATKNKNLTKWRTKPAFWKEKFDKPLARLRKKKEDSKSEMQKNTLVTDTREVQRITQDYYEQLYTNTFVNLEENGQIPEHKYLTKIKSWRNRMLNSSVTNNEVDSVIKSHTSKESLAQYGFNELCKALKN